MVSMAQGQRDGKLVSHYFFNGFWLCVLSALLISLGLELGKNILYHLKQDPEVVALAVPYLRIMGVSIIPMLLFMALKQFTDGLQFTKTAMVLSLSAIPLNIFFNWLFIYGNWGCPRMELNGAGLGTFITRTLIFVALGWVILRHPVFRKYIAVRGKEWTFRLHTFKELLSIGIPSSLQLTLEAGAFAVSSILIGTIGAVELAAHQIALSIASITFMVSMGISQAASIRVSNAFGQKDKAGISSIGKSALIIALIYGSLCALGFSLFRNWLPLLFNDDKAVVELSAYLLLFAAVFQIPDSIQAISAGLLRGIKDVKVPTYFIILAYWVVGIPIGYWLAFGQGMGAAGIWMGFIIGLSLSALFLSLRFKMMNKNSLKPIA
jgi:MATE family multidrug resistance protein